MTLCQHQCSSSPLPHLAVCHTYVHFLPFFSRFSAYVGTVHHSCSVAVIGSGGGSGSSGFLSSSGSHHIAHVSLELTISHADSHLTQQLASFRQPLFAFFSTQLFVQGPREQPVRSEPHSSSFPSLFLPMSRLSSPDHATVMSSLTLFSLSSDVPYRNVPMSHWPQHHSLTR